MPPGHFFFNIVCGRNSILMALITYLTRVHFADGVLEEALRSELELYGRKRPVIHCRCRGFPVHVRRPAVLKFSNPHKTCPL